MPEGPHQFGRFVKSIHWKKRDTHQASFTQLTGGISQSQVVTTDEVQEACGRECRHWHIA